MRARGQTLLLFVLSLLMLTLMVCMTLSIGMKAREKMELQTAADAAAWSNAVATARTYNTIAFMNRAQIGHLVSMAGVQSLISWSGYYYGSVNAAYLSSVMILAQWIPGLRCCLPHSGCGSFCGCTVSGIRDINRNLIRPLSAERQRLRAVFDSLDHRAGKQARDLQGAASRLHQLGELPAYGWLRLTKLQNQALAEDIIARASDGSPWPGEWKAPGGGDRVTLREVDTPPLGSGPFAVAPIRLAHTWATMGSRGHPFVTGRRMGESFINMKLSQVVRAPNQVRAVGSMGSGYFDRGMTHAAMTVGGEISWADDHGSTVTRFNQAQNCPWNRVMTLPGGPAYVRSTYEQDTTDVHRWFMGGDPDAVEIHTMGPSYVPPRGIWPRFMDYNFLKVHDEGDVFGQPKNMVVLQRDLTARPAMQADPWNLFFRFRFTPAGQTFDNRALRLADGTDISKQTAVATGIAYYHRQGHWNEPPNLFNAFWRAGLVHPDVDDSGRGTNGDVADLMNAVGTPVYGDAYDELFRNGWRGIQ